jgi:hypothetical protein
MDLRPLAQGPKNILRTMSFWHTDLAAIQVALSCNSFGLVPDDNVGLSASEIATATSMDNDRPNRFLKMLATHRIFEEVDGKFRHTALSNFLKTDLYRAMAEEQLDVCFKATSDMDDWIEASPYNSSDKDSPFYRQFKKDFYKYHFEDLELGKRFSDAMRSRGTSVYLYVQHCGLRLTLITFDNSFKVLRDNCDWRSLTNKKVVDVGGGNGHVPVDLARVRGRYPLASSSNWQHTQEFEGLTFTVQDWSPQQLEDGDVHDPGDSVKYQLYDYYTPQPIRDAGVYLCRAAFHNHNDAESIRMLKALIPALEGRSDSPVVLIKDLVVPKRPGGEVTTAEAN